MSAPSAPQEGQEQSVSPFDQLAAMMAALITLQQLDRAFSSLSLTLESLGSTKH